jgi:hypothetical protein
MKLTKNFNDDEFFVSDQFPEIARRMKEISPSCIKASLYLLCRYVLQPLRDELNIPIRITSGVRNRRLLKQLYGSMGLLPPRHSLHEDGIACDFVLPGNKDKLKEAFDYIKLFLGDHYSELILYKDANGYRNIHVALPSPREQLTKIKEV